MIFCARNDVEAPTWELVLNGTKLVTRRVKPEPVGAVRAVCPGRGKKAVCRVRIVSCELESKWWARFKGLKYNDLGRVLEREAKLEGFGSWEALQKWLHNHTDRKPLYRIGFEIIEKGSDRP